MWEPINSNFRGFIALMLAVKKIAQTDGAEAVGWASQALEHQPSLEGFKRVQLSHRHSKDYPLLIVQPQFADTPWNERTIEGSYRFTVECFVVGEDPDALTIALLVYLLALYMLFLSAPRRAWVEFFPVGQVADVDVQMGPIAFGQLGTSRESADLYVRDCAVQLTITLSELLA